MLETLNGAPQLGMDSDWGAAAKASVTELDPAALFGETTNQLREAPHLQITEGTRVEDGASLEGLPGQQLMVGLIAEGWATAEETAADALSQYIDEGGVRFSAITDSKSGAAYDWLQFYMGDTEVGYLFPQGTTELIGIVGDGDIYGA